MSVWKNPTNWRRRHLIHRLIWGLGLGVVIPGVLLWLVTVWWNVYLMPLIDVKLAGLLEVPVLNLVFATLFFFGCPGLIWVALISFCVGVKILFDF